MGQAVEGGPGTSATARRLGRRLSKSGIVKWARAYRAREGAWPTEHSGPIPESPGDTWSSINAALIFGGRGLAGNSSLRELLHGYQHNPIRQARPKDLKLTEEQIVRWAEAYRQRHGRLPHQHAGVVEGGAGLTWMTLDEALRRRMYGLPGGSSLAHLLGKKPGTARNTHSVPLTKELILKWVDAHRERTGEWPTARSGPVAEAPGTTWQAVMTALHGGYRGLRGGMTLGQFLHKYRGAPLQVKRRSPLTVEQILAWADAHHARSGQWPIRRSGEIPGTDGETWENVSNALFAGVRSLPRTSLAKLLCEHRGVRNPSGLPPLTVEQILGWADEHKRRAGKWPNAYSGEIAGSGGETWRNVYNALKLGGRGLGIRTTLNEFLRDHRGVLKE